MPFRNRSSTTWLKSHLKSHLMLPGGCTDEENIPSDFISMATLYLNFKTLTTTWSNWCRLLTVDYGFYRGRKKQPTVGTKLVSEYSAVVVVVVVVFVVVS